MSQSRNKEQSCLADNNLAAESADLAFWVIYPAQKTAWMSDKGRAIYGFDAQQALNRDVICGRVHQ